MPPIRISPDRLEALLELQGPAEILVVAAELKEAGVVFGLDKLALAKAIESGTGGGEVCIARGIAPQPSRPQRVELDMDSSKVIGKVDSHTMRMDYRERGGVHSVRAGDRIGVLLPPEPGAPGNGVDGEELAPRPSGELEARVGAAIRSETGECQTLLLFAEIDGVVKTSATGELCVSDLLEISGDVDLSTGNIDVAGSVQVRGTVRSGFRVKARHDIDIVAAVENADVKAGCSVTVGAGILGGGTGVVQAGEGIRAKFAQNATLRCDGDVELQVDTNSGIECGGMLLAREGAGHLRGGSYRAGAGVWVRELGSTRGVPTSVQVGRNPGLTRELARVISALRANQGRAKKLQRERDAEESKRVGRALTHALAGSARRAMKAQRELLKTGALLKKRRKELESTLAQEEPPFVRVEGRIHEGVQLQIQGARLFIDHSRPGGTFRRDAQTGDIISDS